MGRRHILELETAYIPPVAEFPMPPTTTKDALAYLLSRYPHGLSHTRAVKLLWLAELRYFEQRKERLTDAHWFKYDHGPFTKDIIITAELEDHLFSVSDVEWEGKSMRQIKVTGEIPAVPETVSEAIDGVARMFNRDRLKEILEHVYADPFFESFEYGQDFDFSRLMDYRGPIWTEDELEAISKQVERPYKGLLYLAEDGE